MPPGDTNGPGGGFDPARTAVLAEEDVPDGYSVVSNGEGGRFGAKIERGGSDSMAVRTDFSAPGLLVPLILRGIKKERPEPRWSQLLVLRRIANR